MRGDHEQVMRGDKKFVGGGGGVSGWLKEIKYL